MTRIPDNPGYPDRLVWGWPLLHDTRQQALQCPACNTDLNLLPDQREGERDDA